MLVFQQNLGMILTQLLRFVLRVVDSSIYFSPNLLDFPYTLRGLGLFFSLYGMVCSPLKT